MANLFKVLFYISGSKTRTLLCIFLIFSQRKNTLKYLKQMADFLNETLLFETLYSYNISISQQCIEATIINRLYVQAIYTFHLHSNFCIFTLPLKSTILIYFPLPALQKLS